MANCAQSCAVGASGGKFAATHGKRKLFVNYVKFKDVALQCPDSDSYCDSVFHAIPWSWKSGLVT